MTSTQTILAIFGFIIVIASAVIVHFRSINVLKDKIHDVEKDIERLKGRDDLQQTIIDQIGKQNEGLIPHLLDALKNKGINDK